MKKLLKLISVAAIVFSIAVIPTASFADTIIQSLVGRVVSLAAPVGGTTAGNPISAGSRITRGLVWRVAKREL